MSTIDNAELAKRLEELNVLVNPDVLIVHHAIIDDDPSSELILAMYRNLPTILSALRAQEGMEAEARFLLDRLDELDLTEMSGPLYRDFAGHVAPSIARLRAMIAAAPQEAGR